MLPRLWGSNSIVIDPARVHLFGADNMALTGGTANQMSEIIVVDSFDYVIFGGTGDLAQRKIFPAFYHQELDGQLPVDARLISVARSEMSSDAFVRGWRHLYVNLSRLILSMQTLSRVF